MHYNPQTEQLIQKAYQLANQSQWGQALHSLDQVRVADPQYVNDNADIQNLAATCLLNIGRHAPAEKAFLRLLELAPRRTNARVDLAGLYRQIGEDGKSIEQLRIAIDGEPQNSYAIRQLSAWHMDQGDYVTAEKVLAPLIALLRAGAISDPGPAVIFARLALATGREQEGFDLLERFSGDQNLSGQSRRLVLRGLGEFCDRLGRFDEAFDYFSRAQQEEAQPYDPDQNSARIDALIEAWTPEVARSMCRAAPVAGAPRCVFVLGMPRSGTSLSERIIGAHPEGCACGELQALRPIMKHFDPDRGAFRPLLMKPEFMTPELITNAASSYVNFAKQSQVRVGSDDAKVLSDKNPYNFYYIPLIASIFPGCSIVHTMRDPVDTCLSNFFQFFMGGHRHVSDLYNLGRYYRDYQRLMKHWHLLADDLDVKILDVLYQDIVKDQEVWSRKIIEHVGLGWDDSCLQFHKVKRAARTASKDQVRKPMYTSSLNRRDNYEAHIGPLLAGISGDERPTE